MQTIEPAHALVLVSLSLGLIGAYSYIRDTLAGKTTPNRVSWGMWALAPLIGTAAAFDSGADMWASARVFLAGFVPLLIFIASFANRSGYWRLTAFDLICGLFSIVALGVWTLVESPRAAILLAAFGDGIAALPTIIKAWRFPETETGITYVLSFLGVLIILPSIPVWNIENCAFQLYLLIANALLCIAANRRRIAACFNPSVPQA
ncbi:MAG: hypothetical protein K1X83_04710 [Oligoflexia bacterium]|nr:hypothetical protein [Oligoflexia bacterium]